MPREQIWRDEGWFKGPDKKWRFEIDDSRSAMADIAQRPMLTREGGENVTPLFQSLSHPALYDAYPNVKYTEMQAIPGNGASYRPRAGALQPRVSVGRDGDSRSLALHEVQHDIQHREGFARGGNPEGLASRLQHDLSSEMERITPDPTTIMDATAAARLNAIKEQLRRVPQDDMQAYRRLAGEVEARTVQKRLPLTADQRRERAPWLDYDVPESQQIVRP